MEILQKLLNGSTSLNELSDVKVQSIKGSALLKIVRANDVWQTRSLLRFEDLMSKREFCN